MNCQSKQIDAGSKHQPTDYWQKRASVEPLPRPTHMEVCCKNNTQHSSPGIPSFGYYEQALRTILHRHTGATNIVGSPTQLTFTPQQWVDQYINTNMIIYDREMYLTVGTSKYTHPTYPKICGLTNNIQTAFLVEGMVLR